MSRGSEVHAARALARAGKGFEIARQRQLDEATALACLRQEVAALAPQGLTVQSLAVVAGLAIALLEKQGAKGVQVLAPTEEG